MKSAYLLISIMFLTTLVVYVNAQSIITGCIYEDINQNGIKDKNEVGLKDITVSNQMFVVKTDDQGIYRIEIKPGFDLVFVSLPSAYRCNGSFWKKVQPNTSIDFGLIKQAIPTSFSFIQASDTHISDASIDRMDKFRAIVDSIKPSMVMITGDLVKDALRVSEEEATKLYELFKKESSKIKTPLWLVPGNHELFGIERHLSLVSAQNPLYGRKMYKHYFGPDYYSFNYEGIHFVALNSLEYDDLFYYGHIDSTQLEWLKKDVADIPLSTPIVTFQHVPFFTGGMSLDHFEADGLGRTIEKAKGTFQYRHVVSNAFDVLEILKGHSYPLALAGHYHYQQKFSVEGLNTRFEQTGAVVGPSSAGPIHMPSGVTLYSVTSGKIDEGHFIRLDK